MKSVFSFIVKPVGSRYDNKIDVDGKELILNTSIESFKSVNNIAEVVEVPMAYNTDIKVGDKVVIHHNVFRRFYDIKGKQKIVEHILKRIYIFVMLIKYFYINTTLNG